VGSSIAKSMCGIPVTSGQTVEEGPSLQSTKVPKIDSTISKGGAPGFEERIYWWVLLPSE
jgi:hypothetical protein